MKTYLVLICFAASVGLFEGFKTIVDRLGFAGVSGIGITFLTAFVIYTVKNAQTENKWRFKISPQIKQHIMDVVELVIVLIIFIVTAVVLFAIADTGSGSLRKLVESLPRLFDV